MMFDAAVRSHGCSTRGAGDRGRVARRVTGRLPALHGSAPGGGLSPPVPATSVAAILSTSSSRQDHMTQQEWQGWGLADTTGRPVRTQGHGFPWESSGLILLDPQPLIAASGLEQGAATSAAPLRALGLCLHPIAAQCASLVPLNWQWRCRSHPFAAAGPAVPPCAAATPPGWGWG